MVDVVVSDDDYLMFFAVHGDVADARGHYCYLVCSAEDSNTIDCKENN
jgi:hypothetical protein